VKLVITSLLEDIQTKPQYKINFDSLVRGFVYDLKQHHTGATSEVKLYVHYLSNC
jgi:hypothetical protein